ncbi:hypothetical protein TRVL_05461 [Trypanosoma vivax]|nr:hypothetical protein TRVL_05461 [Trypanosoma vivax]
MARMDNGAHSKHRRENRRTPRRTVPKVGTQQRPEKEHTKAKPNTKRSISSEKSTADECVAKLAMTHAGAIAATALVDRATTQPLHKRIRHLLLQRTKKIPRLRQQNGYGAEKPRRCKRAKGTNEYTETGQVEGRKGRA